MNEHMQEIVTLYSAGSIPGIPGDHGAGTYLVDWNERSITPVQPQGIPTEPLVQEPIQEPVQDVSSEQEEAHAPVEDTVPVQTSVQANTSPSVQGG